MKIVLAMPPWRKTEVYTGNFGLFVGGFWHPYGLLSLAATFREADHDVTFLDGAFVSEDEMVKRVKEIGPDAVAFYITTFLFHSVGSVTARLKQEIPGLTIIGGGPLATGWRERLLQELPALDVTVYGEGEHTGLDLLNALENDRDLASVASIVHRPDGGDPVRTPPRQMIQDLDALPLPARDLLGNIKKYVPPLGTYRRLPAMYMYTSRGCNGECIFCWQLNSEGAIRMQSAERVLREIDHIYETYGIKEIRFFDDNFTYDEERTHTILDGIIERDYDLTFYAASRVDDIDREILFKMKKAKFWGIMFGIEAGTQRDLDSLKKGVTVEQNRQAVEWAHKAGLWTVTPFIFGIPGQTEADIDRAIDFAIEIDSDVVNFHSLAPYPGAELYQNSEKYGRIASDDPRDFTFEGASFVPFTLDRQTIIDKRQEAFGRFYGRPSYMWKQLISVRSWAQAKVLIAGGISFIMTRLFKGEFTPHGTQV
ncbi:MAG: radical SAM protein [bacterium]|nr:radical SAM protein [bacterium]